MEETHQQFQFPRPIPYYAQVASPELAEKIFSQGMNPGEDPRWKEWGFSRQEEYTHWVERACGIICVKMVVEALGGACYSVQQWVQRGLEAGGYLVVEGENGARVEKGWIHNTLAELIKREGFEARACKASLWEVANFLKQGMLLIASVSYEIGTDGPVTKNTGHLVVVSGLETHLLSLENFIVQNPSGRRAELQSNAIIPALRFSQAYSGRVILAGYSS